MSPMLFICLCMVKDMAEDLKELRKEIDSVDTELVVQLKKRFDITSRIGKYKARTGMELFCPEREAEKLESLRKALGDYAYSEYIVRLFGDIMDYSKLQQSRDIFGTEDVFLIGMPGCGKSVIGSEIARKTYREFIDMDALFSNRYGITPASMIEKNGEDEFRDKETELLRFIVKNRKGSEKGRVISCGGGIVVRDVNREFLTLDSIVIYIKRNIDELSRKGRPLSSSVGVQKLYEQRAGKYESWSSFIIENDGSLSDAIDKIMKKLARC